MKNDAYVEVSSDEVSRNANAWLKNRQDHIEELREELIAEKMKSKFLFWSPYSTREKAIEALSSDIWSKYSLIVLRGCVWEGRALDLVAASKVAATVKVPAEYISVFWRNWS